jgi:hypothetical protein
VGAQIRMSSSEIPHRPGRKRTCYYLRRRGRLQGRGQNDAAVLISANRDLRDRTEKNAH